MFCEGTNGVALQNILSRLCEVVCLQLGFGGLWIKPDTVLYVLNETIWL